MNQPIIVGITLSLMAYVSHAAPISGQGTWETTLQGRDLDGNLATAEAYYDTVLGITWLANAGYAGGTMNWVSADAWATGLNPYSSGITGWRLPTVNPVDGTTADDATFSNIGDEDQGYNVSAPGTHYAGSTASELAHMFFNTLGDKAYCDPATSTVSTCSAPQAGWGPTNTGPFSNLAPSTITDPYWSATGYAPSPGTRWYFNFYQGLQTSDHEVYSYAYAWAVHSGDVGAPTLPAPAAVDDGPIAVIQGLPTVIPVGANDTNFTDPVAVAVTTQPTKGTIGAISTPGPAAGMTVTYTANIGAVGADSFGYEMTDSTSATDTATVTVNISPDTDGDGIGDPSDNCTLTSNPTQLDTDGDGYGNICDGDLNNSGLTTSTDFNLLRSVLNQPAASSALAAAADMNGSGLVTSTDFNLLRARLNTAPGPSGLHP